MSITALVAESLEGDTDAFTELVERYQAMAYDYAFATIGDAQLAEDAAQQAFLTAYQNLGGLRDHARFGGWLRGIVRFESLRILRGLRGHATDSLDIERAIDPIDGSASPEAQAEEREAFEGIAATLWRLPDRQRTVAVLYYVYEFSQRDVASFLDLPVSAVNNRLREARNMLRKEGTIMVAGTATPTPDFAARIGKVLHAGGMTVDARFEGTIRPSLMSAVRIGDTDRAITAFVSQYLNDDVARLIVTDTMDSPDSITPGTEISDERASVSAPMSTAAIQQIVAGATTANTGATIETGIKVVDLFAPLAANGTVAIVGAMNVGKLVLVDELIYRLSVAETSLTILVFLQVPDETGVVHRLEYRANGSLTVIGIPVSDASPAALASLLERVDTIITMDKSLGEQRRYPAIDPVASRLLAIESADIVAEARALLQQSQNDNPRIHVLRDYLTQPFFVAEPFTGKPGLRVPEKIAESDLEGILHDDIKALTEIDLVMGGSLSQALEASRPS